MAVTLKVVVAVAAWPCIVLPANSAAAAAVRNAKRKALRRESDSSCKCIERCPF
ncbi:MAG TPA: hypothetical protein VGB91_11995 [Rhizomicrobium sp.]